MKALNKQRFQTETFSRLLSAANFSPAIDRAIWGREISERRCEAAPDFVAFALALQPPSELVRCARQIKTRSLLDFGFAQNSIISTSNTPLRRSQQLETGPEQRRLKIKMTQCALILSHYKI